MLNRAVVASMIVVSVHAAWPQPTAMQTSTQQIQSIGDPDQLKGTVLERMTREAPTYRGPNGLRLKWEWWDGTSRSYLFEKNVVVQEASARHPNSLRPEWVLRDVKVSFQEIYRLNERDDDKLAPILSHLDMLDRAPSSTFEGLTLYGKDGEVKGTVTRKYIVSEVDYPTTLGQRMGAGLAGVPLLFRHFYFLSALEIKDPKTGKLEIAAGNSYDAVNLKWGDIKNRIADDMSEEKAAGDRSLLRVAYAKSLKVSVPDR